MNDKKKLLPAIGALMLLAVLFFIWQGANRGDPPDPGLVIVTQAPTGKPDPTVSPVVTEGPDITEAPEETPTPEVTISPSPTEKVKPTKKGKKPTPTVTPEDDPSPTPEEDGSSVREDGEYSSKEEVAEYISRFGHLPGNYITKKDAEALGWRSSEGNLGEVAPGKSIGGDRFGNYEGQLPSKKGRKYYECDIDYDGGYRGSKRIIYSSDGLVFYTEDHYNTFEQLY